MMSLHHRIKHLLIKFFSLLPCTQIVDPRPVKFDPPNEMPVQLVIPVPDDHTSVNSHTVPVVVSHTNVSPLSYTALRDPNLIEDLKPFATRYGLKLHKTFQTRFLLYFFLYYQIIYQPKKTANTHITTAIKILETA